MYSKTHWQDRVVDPETGEVVQEGTFMSAEHFNNMEDGIEANDTAIAAISESVETIETTLDTGVGTTITLTVNSSTFVMKLALKNSEGNILSESEVDLPIESMIVNAEYVEATKSLVLTLQSGSKVTVPLSALINGLVNDTRKVAGMDLKKDITVAEMVTALGVDKKANKTSVSSSNETTSVINVTDAKAQMAMVAKISGKTYKRNLFNIKEATTGSPASFTITDTYISNAVIDTRAQLMLFVLAGTAMTRVIQDDTVTVGKHSYSFTATANADRLTIRHNGSSVDFNCQVPVNIVSGKTYTLSMNVTGNNPKVVGGVKISEIQLEEGSVANPYVPFGLISTPVESVVSVGKNIFDKYGEWYKPSSSNDVTINADGSITVKGTWFCSTQINLQPNTDYTLSGLISGASVSGAIRIIDKDRNNTIAAITDMGTWKTITFNSGSNTTVHLALYSGNASSGNSTYRNIQLERGSTATALAPFNKTTVLVPSAVKNLPDYGCSVGNIANEIDFENGVYYHRVKKIKLATLSWENPSDYQSHRRIAAANVKTGGSGTSTSLISNVYTADTSPVGNGSVDKTICFYNASLYVSDWSKQTDKATFVKYLQDSDAEIVYELASAETIPLTDYLRPLPVENGGTLTLVNEHNLDVNSTIKYKKEVN